MTYTDRLDMFAAAALTGLLAHGFNHDNKETLYIDYAEEAIKHAEAILYSLTKTEEAIWKS